MEFPNFGEMWIVIDKDGSGSIDYEEFLQMVRLVSTNQKCTRILLTGDSTNGQMSFDKAHAAFSSLYK